MNLPKSACPVSSRCNIGEKCPWGHLCHPQARSPLCSSPSLCVVCNEKMPICTSGGRVLTMRSFVVRGDMRRGEKVYVYNSHSGGSSQICSIHGRRKYQCKECEGIGICCHGRLKNQCQKCAIEVGVVIGTWRKKSKCRLYVYGGGYNRRWFWHQIQRQAADDHRIDLCGMKRLKYIFHYRFFRRARRAVSLIFAFSGTSPAVAWHQSVVDVPLCDMPDTRYVLRA